MFHNLKKKYFLILYIKLVIIYLKIKLINVPLSLKFNSKTHLLDDSKIRKVFFSF
jgi:hypothetical protein